MQVECPKCHFRQPDDRFCARCGIDMQTYNPPEISVVQKLFQNGTVIFFVGMVLLLSASFYYFNLSKSQRNFIETNKKAIFISNSHHSSSTSNTDQNTSFSSKETPPASPTSAPFPKNSETDNNQATKENGSPTTSNNNGSPTESPTEASTDLTAAAKKPIVLTLMIQYAEVTLKGLYALEDEAKNSGQFISSDYSQGTINLGRQKITSLKNEIHIYGTDKKLIKPEKTETWFQGLKSSNENNTIGLTSELKIKEISTESVLADLKISKRYQVNISDPNSNNFLTLDYLGSIELSDSQFFFIGKVLTTTPMIKQQEYLTSISPFEILKSAYFKNGETFSVFFYNFEK